MPTTKPLISVQAAKSVLAVRGDTAEFDDAIANNILTATYQIEKAVNRYFTRQSFVEYYPTGGTELTRYDLGGMSTDGLYSSVRPSRFVLHGYPVDTGLTIDVRYDPAGAFGDDTIVDSTYYTVDAETGILRLMYATSNWQRALRVSYTGGYAIDANTDSLNNSAHPLIRQACATQTSFLQTRLRADNIGMDTERGSRSVGAARFTSIAGLTPEAAHMVAFLRQPILGVG
jgi:hypothetical protein